MVAFDPFHKLVLAGSHRVPGTFLHAGLNGPGAHDHAGRMGQVADKCAEGLGQGHLDGVIVYLLKGIQHVAQEGGSLKA